MASRQNNIGFIIIIVLLALTSAFSIKLFMRQRAAHDKVDIHTFPYKIGDWVGQDNQIFDYEYEILETHNLISREYTNPSGEQLSLFIIYSETNRSVFHPPEVCLLGSGLIVDKQVEKINGGKYQFTTNKLYTTKDDYRGITLYSYRAGNLYTHNFYLQQALFAFNQLLGSHKGGATIRVSMAIVRDEAVTLQILKSFLIETVRLIDSLS